MLPQDQRRSRMRKTLKVLALALVMAALTASCASTFESAWEGEARRNCGREQGPTRQSDCNDRVDDTLREMRR
jgi:hypothetical protein